MAQTGGNFFDQFDPPQNGAPPTGDNYFDQFDPPPQQRTILAAHPVPHTGYAAQIRAMSGGPDKVAPRSFGDLGQSYADVTAGYATGATASLPGIPGNVESLGRQGLSKVGVPVSTETLLPTSEDIGNWIANGPPANQDVAFGRFLGDVSGPGAIFKGIKMAAPFMPAKLASPIAGAGPTDSALAAHEAGYVLPPNLASKQPGIVSSLASGISGKWKLWQAASVKNQEVTNRLATEAMGLPADVPLSPEALNAVRAADGQAYTNVGTAVPKIATDTPYEDIVSGLGGRMSEAAKEFPGLIKLDDIENLSKTLLETKEFSPQAGLGLVRQLRSNAAANLKAFNDPSKQALGLAQRHAADAVDDLMERNLTAAGKPDLVQAYRDARQRIAQSYDVEAALDPVSGDVSARMLTALAKKGRPLSGQLKDIADAARSFPKATQSPSTFGGEEPLGILDYGAAVASHGATIPLSIARPGSRSFIFSAPYQKALMSRPGGGSSYASTVGALAAPVPGIANRLPDRSQ